MLAEGLSAGDWITIVIAALPIIAWAGAVYARMGWLGEQFHSHAAHNREEHTRLWEITGKHGEKLSDHGARLKHVENRLDEE